jgi:hypothetical protein
MHTQEIGERIHTIFSSCVPSSGEKPCALLPCKSMCPPPMCMFHPLVKIHVPYPPPVFPPPMRLSILLLLLPFSSPFHSACKSMCPSLSNMNVFSSPIYLSNPWSLSSQIYLCSSPLQSVCSCVVVSVL